MMNAVVKPYHEMCLNSSELIVPRDTYQRALHPARVARIAKEFDERVANEPKISFRDGHYYVMDGQNTIAARKFLNDSAARPLPAGFSGMTASPAEFPASPVTRAVRSPTYPRICMAWAFISSAALADSSALAAVDWVTLSISATAELICLVP